MKHADLTLIPWHMLPENDGANKFEGVSLLFQTPFSDT